jgi:DHA1 family bicyclomycin/chloramphenicol resistance-like MFS transporter
MASLRQMLLVPVLGALTAFGPVAIDMYLPALPEMAHDLGSAQSGAQMTLGVFFFGFGFGQLVHGPLSDRLGRRAPLLAGLLLYTAASIGCALAPSMEALVALRFLQALGGSAGPVLARAMVRDLWDREGAARILSIMVLIMSLAPLLAPLAGGYVLVWAGWRAIFWFLVAFGVVCIAASLWILGETLPPAKRARRGIGGMLAAYAGLLASRKYLSYAVAGGMIYAGLFAYLTGSPFVFITLHGVPAERYGWLFAMNVLGIMIVASVNGRIVTRLGVDRLLDLGLAVAAIAGTALALAAATGIAGFAGILVPLWFFVSSIGMIGANAMAGALAIFPDRIGQASALAGTIQFLVGGLGGTAVGALHDGTAVPMSATIAAAGLLGFGLRRLLRR